MVPLGWMFRAQMGPHVSHTLPCSLQVECKAVMVFLHYCVVSNYFWLFIEGLYLFTLLVETFFPERRYFYWYTLIGWGKSPAVAWTGPGLMASCVLGAAVRDCPVRGCKHAPAPAGDTHSWFLGTFLLFLPIGSRLSEKGYTQESF